MSRIAIFLTLFTLASLNLKGESRSNSEQEGTTTYPWSEVYNRLHNLPEDISAEEFRMEHIASLDSLETYVHDMESRFRKSPNKVKEADLNEYSDLISTQRKIYRELSEGLWEEYLASERAYSMLRSRMPEVVFEDTSVGLFSANLPDETSIPDALKPKYLLVKNVQSFETSLKKVTKLFNSKINYVREVSELPDTSMSNPEFVSELKQMILQDTYLFDRFNEALSLQYDIEDMNLNLLSPAQTDYFDDMRSRLTQIKVYFE